MTWRGRTNRLDHQEANLRNCPFSRLTMAESKHPHSSDPSVASISRVDALQPENAEILAAEGARDVLHVVSRLRDATSRADGAALAAAARDVVRERGAFECGQWSPGLR